MPARSGSDLRLSIDAQLQQAMVTAFGEFEGSAVAMDPRTGEILAMVSLPAYDPNLFVNGISHSDFRALNDNPSRPQFNRLGKTPPLMLHLRYKFYEKTVYALLKKTIGIERGTFFPTAGAAVSDEDFYGESRWPMPLTSN